jgi:hypothetical protein
MKTSLPTNSDDIPLRILICDPDPAGAEFLHSALTREEGVAACLIAKSIGEAQASIRGGNINAIFIDVLGLGIHAGADFVFSIRKALPEIAFVLFIDLNVAESNRDEFYNGERSRFSHYFTLDKRTPAGAFGEEVRAVLSKCRRDLSWGLSKLSLQRLREEAAVLDKDCNGSSDARKGLVSQVQEIVGRLLADKSPTIARRSVFLSYRFAEKEYIEGLTSLLENEGFRPITGQMANSYISQAVLQRIKEAEFFLCLMTRDKTKTDGTFTTSSWLLEEKGAALAFGKPIVLMIEEGVDDFGGLQGDWQRIHFGPKGFLTAALKAVAQLKSYSGG